jgi:hypothetical protein
MYLTENRDDAAGRAVTGLGCGGVLGFMEVEGSPASTLGLGFGVWEGHRR